MYVVIFVVFVFAYTFNFPHFVVHLITGHYFDNVMNIIFLEFPRKCFVVTVPKFSQFAFMKNSVRYEVYCIYHIDTGADLGIF